MQTEPLKAPETTTFERRYPGTVFYVQQVRADLNRLVKRYPFADDLVFLASELAANAIIHTRSHELDGEITVRAWIRPGEYAWVEVVDQGGPWTAHQHADDRPHGLDIVARLAGTDNWGIDGDDACRVAWFRLNWPAEP